MEKVCAWCGASLGGRGGQAGSGVPTSHGICRACSERLLGDVGIPLGLLLDSLEVPVLLVDQEGVVRDASPPAFRAWGKDRSAVEGQLSGEVFECVHAREPEGCGRTIHCSGCAIRQAVNHTFDTGEPLIRVPATLKVGDPDHPESVRFFISTRRFGDRIHLLVEPA